MASPTVQVRSGAVKPLPTPPPPSHKTSHKAIKVAEVYVSTPKDRAEVENNLKAYFILYNMMQNRWVKRF